MNLARAWRWARQNLFQSVANTLLSLLVLLFAALILRGLLLWVFSSAQWGVIADNFRLLMVGAYPGEALWRVWVGVFLVALLVGMSWAQLPRVRALAFIAILVLGGVAVLLTRGSVNGFLALVTACLVILGWGFARLVRVRNILTYAWILAFIAVLVLAGTNFGSGGVPTNRWGGLLLTMLLSVVAIAASFPLGVLLAVGRTSRLGVVSVVSTAYIEIVRGIPLVVVLFVAQLFVPLAFGGLRIDPVLRAMIGFTLFTAAYLAEYVRGGLQAVPPGQAEAARALGLSGTQTLIQIVLPQAIRTVIPGIVGQFIALFKDTSLVAIIGLSDLLRIGTTLTANPAYIGRYQEVYVVVALIYFVFSYAMSLGSRALERRLAQGR